MPLTDPVPSSAFDVLERNVQDTDKFVNQETGTFTNRVGKVIKPIPVIEDEANAAVISLGWHQVGLFADGFTYTLQNDIAKDSLGDWYRWNGTLPKVVVAGTLPSSDANFVKIDYKSHADLSDRNPADGSAHNADDVAKNGGGSVQDFIVEASQKLDSFATDGKVSGNSDATSAASLSINGVSTEMNRHAFEDWTIINPSISNLGYASFDAKPTLNGPGVQEHFVGYQSRPIYASSADLTGYCHGYNTQLTVTGDGDVNGVIGVSIANPNVTGTGKVLNLIGLQIADLTAGQQYNYSIFAGSAPSRFGGSLQIQSASNSNITDGTGWIWTTDGTPSGVKSGGIYYSTGGLLQIFTKNFDTLLTADENGVQSVKDFTAEKKFGCNGKLPQGSVSANSACTDLSTAIALINQLRAALVANGICI